MLFDNDFTKNDWFLRKEHQILYFNNSYCTLIKILCVIIKAHANVSLFIV